MVSNITTGAAEVGMDEERKDVTLNT